MTIVAPNTPASESIHCVYCGEPATTEDHVPPKNLFPAGRIGLIKVPSCLTCNNNPSKDDEFFRNVLVNDNRIYKTHEAQEMVAAYERSLQRPQAAGLQKAMSQKTMRVPLFSTSGLFQGYGTALKTDFTRERKVLERIITGLFYHEFQRPHPSENSIDVFSSQHLKGKKEKLDFVLECIGYIKPENKKGDNPDIFRYGFAIAEDNPNGTFWVLTFYGKIPFFIYCAPPTPPNE